MGGLVYDVDWVLDLTCANIHAISHIMTSVAFGHMHSHKRLQSTLTSNLNLNINIFYFNLFYSIIFSPILFYSIIDWISAVMRWIFLYQYTLYFLKQTNLTVDKIACVLSKIIHGFVLTKNESPQVLLLLFPSYFPWFPSFSAVESETFLCGNIELKTVCYYIRDISPWWAS